MSLLLVMYCLNAMLLLIHEVESAFEKEWELLHLPGGINGFLLLHIPIILLIFYGIIELTRSSVAGTVVAIVFGAAGLLPFFVHELLVKRKDHFNRIISRVILYVNAILGILVFLYRLSKLHYNSSC